MKYKIKCQECGKTIGYASSIKERNIIKKSCVHCRTVDFNPIRYNRDEAQIKRIINSTDSNKYQNYV